LRCSRLNYTSDPIANYKVRTHCKRPQQHRSDTRLHRPRIPLPYRLIGTEDHSIPRPERAYPPARLASSEMDLVPSPVSLVRVVGSRPPSRGIPGPARILSMALACRTCAARLQRIQAVPVSCAHGSQSNHARRHSLDLDGPHHLALLLVAGGSGRGGDGERSPRRR